MPTPLPSVWHVTLSVPDSSPCTRQCIGQPLLALQVTRSLPRPSTSAVQMPQCEEWPCSACGGSSVDPLLATAPKQSGLSSSLSFWPPTSCSGSPRKCRLLRPYLAEQLAPSRPDPCTCRGHQDVLSTKSQFIGITGMEGAQTRFVAVA